jgi:hypothetical protein
VELKPDDYILAYWMASDAYNNNWYMMIWKSNGKWHGEYTFRYCKDDNSDPWNNKDEKSRYSFSVSGDTTEDSILKNSNAMFDFIKLKYNDFSDFFLVQGDFLKFKEIAETKHYLHIRSEDLTK